MTSSAHLGKGLLHVPAPVLIDIPDEEGAQKVDAQRRHNGHQLFGLNWFRGGKR